MLLRGTPSDAHERAEEDKVLFRWQSAYGSAKGLVKFKLCLAGSDHLALLNLSVWKDKPGLGLSS